MAEEQEKMVSAAFVTPEYPGHLQEIGQALINMGEALKHGAAEVTGGGLYVTMDNEKMEIRSDLRIDRRQDA